jgi:hypothetical protein
MSIIDGMILSDFTGSPGVPSLPAAQQQAYLLTALYQGRRDLLERLFAGHPQWGVRYWDFDDSTITPNVAIGQQGRDWFIVLTGTTNIPQMVGNALGYVADKYDLQANVRVNTFWQAMWNKIKGQIKDVLPAAADVENMHIVGHSYGAAVALLLALDLVRDYGERSTEYFGYGTPSALTGNYSGPLPSVRFRWSNREDPVALLPPRGTFLVNLASSAPYRWFSDGIAWDGYGFERVLNADGSVVNGPDAQRTFPFYLASAVENGFAHHLIGSYNLRLRDAIIRGEGDEETARELYEACDLASQGGPPPGNTIMVPPSTVLTPQTVQDAYYAPAVPLVSEAMIDTAETASLSVRSAVPADPAAWAANFPLSGSKGSSIVALSGTKVILQFSSANGDSWSEVYYSSKPPSQVAPFFSRTSLLMNRRTQMLAQGMTIKRARLIALDATRATSIIGINRQNGTGSVLPYPANCAAIVQLASTNKAAKRYLFLRGIATDDVRVDVNGDVAFQSGSFASALSQYYPALAAAGVYIAKLTGAAAGPPFTPLGCAGVNGLILPGFASITTLAPHAFIPGNRVVLSRFSEKDTAGLNGHYTALAGTAGSTLVVKYQVPENANLPGVSGSVRKEEYLPQPIDPAFCSLITVRGRQSKNEVSQSRGAKRVQVRRSSQ